MPTPSRTSLPEIVAAGRSVLDSEGLAGLTMHAVARGVGVRSPSLYKHVADRDALVRLVADAVVAEIAAHLAPASTLHELAHTMRRWARANPSAFALAFSGHASQGALAAASEPVLRVCHELGGGTDALAAARLVTAWCNGFLTMELAGVFQLGGDVDASFDFAIDGLARALATP